MATVRTICTEALELIGIVPAGGTATTADVNSAFSSFTQLREQWSNERLLHPTQVLQTAAWASGVASKTIGTSGDITTSYGKPSNIEQAFIRDSAGVDYPLQIITNIDYQNLAIKTQESSLPGYLRYDRGAANTLGTLYLWPVPDQDLTLGITSIQNLLVYAIDDTFTDPAGYQEAITFALAIRLCPKFGLPVPGDIRSLADESKATIKRTNSSMDEMDMPGNFGGRWNYHSGWWA